MTNIVPQIIDQIRKHPHINRVTVSKVEWLLIKREIRKSMFVRPSKRPTYGGPFGNINRELWDANFKHMRDCTPVSIIGRPVEYRI